MDTAEPIAKLDAELALACPKSHGAHFRQATGVERAETNDGAIETGAGDFGWTTKALAISTLGVKSVPPGGSRWVVFWQWSFLIANVICGASCQSAIGIGQLAILRATRYRRWY